MNHTGEHQESPEYPEIYSFLGTTLCIFSSTIIPPFFYSRIGKNNIQKYIPWFSCFGVGIILSLIFTTLLIFQQQNELVKIFNDNYIIDNLSVFMKILTTVSCIFILIISKDYIKNIGLNKFEYPILKVYYPS